MCLKFYIFGSVWDSYFAIGSIGFILLTFFIFVQIKNEGALGYLKRLPKSDRSILKMIFYVTESFFIAMSINVIPGYIAAKPFSLLFHEFTNGKNAAAYFGWVTFAIVTFFAVAFLLGLKPLKTLDLVAPGFPLALIFAKNASFCAGCCNGFQTDYGFYNYDTKLREFPVQLVESAEALVIFIILLLIRKKAKLGTMYPIYLMLYSGMRFCSEFLRAYPDAFGHFKIGHILAFAFFSLGAFETALALKFGERIDRAFATCYAKIEKKLKRS